MGAIVVLSLTGCVGGATGAHDSSLGGEELGRDAGDPDGPHDSKRDDSETGQELPDGDARSPGDLGRDTDEDAGGVGEDAATDGALAHGDADAGWSSGLDADADAAADDRGGSVDGGVLDWTRCVPGTFERVGLGHGLGANSSALSGDGRLVAFATWGALASNDTNRDTDVYLLDRATGVLQLVSADRQGRAAGGWNPSLSADGTTLAFVARHSFDSMRPSQMIDVYRMELATGSIRRITEPWTGGEADDASYLPAVSDDGERVAFLSNATNLVEGDTNNVADAFLWVRGAPRVERLSLGSGGEQLSRATTAVALSGDGRRAALAVEGELLLRDLAPQQTRMAGRTPRGDPPNGGFNFPAMDSSGEWLAYASTASNLVPDDTNGAPDVFVATVRDLLPARINVSATGDEDPQGAWVGAPHFSEKGGAIAFVTSAALVPSDRAGADVYLRDLARSQTVLLSNGTGSPFPQVEAIEPKISRDERWMIFTTSAPLDPNDDNTHEDLYLAHVCR